MPAGAKRLHASQQSSDEERSEDGALSEASSAESDPEPGSSRRKRARLSDLRDSDASQESPDRTSISISGDTPTRTDLHDANAPASNGIIQSVTCINFMCHSRLQMDVGPLINFVIGHNGSGKSALLAAITICLGGQARETSRGTSLKSLIKSGEESATVIVRLKNEGTGAYQPEKFGNSISVERTITQSGGGSYKIRSVDGKIIGNTKGEMDSIADHFTLQLDNPMNVLSQDNAREFLLKSTPESKYQFFLRGVQLERLNADYVMMEESLLAMDARMQGFPEDLDRLEKKRDQAKSKHDVAKRQDSHRQRIRLLENQFIWSQVEDKERDVQRLGARLEEIDGDKAEANRKVESTSRRYDTADSKANEAKEAVAASNAKREPFDEKRATLAHELQVGKAKLSTILSEQRVIGEEMKSKERKRKTIEHDIEEEERRLSQENGDSTARLVRQIEDVEREVQEYDTRIKTIIDELPRLEQDFAVAEKKSEEHYRDLQRKRTEASDCRVRVQNLERTRVESLEAFGPGISSLLQAINRDRGFRNRPIGPIGRHITLLKPQWSSVLEVTIGRVLSAFIVTNKADQERLSNMVKRSNAKVTVLIGTRDNIDTSGNEPDPQFDTILKVLEFDNNLVRSQLIIAQAIEQSILIEKQQDGIQAMYGNGRDDPPLTNVKACYCLNESRVGWGNRLAYGSRGESVSGPVPPFKGKARMKTDTEQQLRVERANLERAKGQIDELNRKYEDLQRSQQQCGAQIKSAKQEIENLRKMQKKKTVLKHRLEDERDRATDDTSNLETLKERLTDIQDQLTVTEGSYEASLAQKLALNESQKAIKDQINDIDDQLKELEDEIRALESVALKCQDKRQDTLQAKNTAFEALGELEKAHEAQQAEITKVQQAIDEYIERVETTCPRVSIPRGETTSSIERKIVKMNKDLERAERELGADIFTLEQEYLKAEQSFKSGKEAADDLLQLSRMMMATVRDRRKRWAMFRRAITARAKNQFILLLTERGFRGKILMHHDTRKLDLQIQPDDASNSKGHSAKGLSGGEKSFATVCLLLALWEAMGSPIRCLDEFDVFMDGVNRDVSAKMMIDFARRSVGRQFILLTPLAMANLSLSNDVKIHRLTDPERGQTTLQFRPVGAH